MSSLSRMGTTSLAIIMRLSTTVVLADGSRRSRWSKMWRLLVPSGDVAYFDDSPAMR